MDGFGWTWLSDTFNPSFSSTNDSREMHFTKGLTLTPGNPMKAMKSRSLPFTNRRSINEWFRIFSVRLLNLTIFFWTEFDILIVHSQ
jgi:hypothetical protein